MKKWISLMLAAFLLANCLGGIEAQAADHTYNAEETAKLKGTVWYPGEEIAFEDCAVQVAFNYYNSNGTEDGYDAMIEHVSKYVNEEQCNYYLNGNADSKIFVDMIDNGYQLQMLFIGEELEYINEDGMRACHKFKVWIEQKGADGWIVNGVTPRGTYGGLARTNGDGTKPCYTITLEPYTKPAGNVETPAPGCDHKIDYIITKQPTETEDGIVSVMCTKCPHVEYAYEVSGHGAFLLNSAKKINAAKPGETVTLTTKRWLSFNDEVLKAIEANPEVAVVVEYWYSDGEEGGMRTLTIPAGSKVSHLAHEEGFCGFEYLAYQLALAAMAE